MSAPVILEQCCECGERTANRSLICDGCAPLYDDSPTADAIEGANA